MSDLAPLAGLTSLVSLDLSNNYIVDISPLAGLTSLGRLDLATNAVSDGTNMWPALRTYRHCLD